MIWNAFAISNLLIAITTLPTAIILLIKGRSKLAKIFALEIISVFVWGAFAFLEATSRHGTEAFYFAKIANIGVFFIAIFFLRAALLLIPNVPRVLPVILYLSGLIFSIAIALNKIVIGPQYIFDSFFYHKLSNLGGLSYLFIWLALVTIATSILILRYNDANNDEQKLINSLLLGVPLGFLAGLSNFFPALGIYIYPHGNFLIPLYVLITLFGILRYQLYDVQIVIKRGLVYTILIMTISIVYLIFVLIFEKLLENYIGYRSLPISIFFAFALGVFFFPLRNIIQRFIDRKFFQSSPEKIYEENLLLRREVAMAEKHKSIATLAGGVAHEIKNPLTAILTFTEYLPDKLNDHEFLRRFSAIVKKEVLRIDALVDRLLSYAKPHPLNLKSIHADELIKETLEFLSNQLLKSRVNLHAQYNAGNLKLLIDPDQIRQALLNVLLNAIEAMPDGGDLHVISRVRRRLGSSFYEIEVRDTGEGMGKKDLARIFEPFYSLKEEGSGLGLSITQGIIEEHGGKIKIRSSKGDGTAVVLRFRVEEEETE